MASDNPAMPAPLPMVPMAGSGSPSGAQQDSQAAGGNLGTAAQNDATQAGAAASQAATAAGSTLRRGA